MLSRLHDDVISGGTGDVMVENERLSNVMFLLSSLIRSVYFMINVRFILLYI